MLLLRTSIRTLLVAGASIALAGFGAASASAGTSSSASHPVASHSAAAPDRGHQQRAVGAVFLQHNGTAANTVTAYERHADGTLTEAGTYPTGGRGGTELGAVVDPLASQGSLVYDPRHHLLFAVNAGSDSISVFGVRGATLQLRQVLPSHGTFPTSISVSGDLAFVLNAGDDGSVSGYRILGHRVVGVPGTTRSLGLGNAAVPAFLSSPAQVAIAPDHRHLVVATKTHNTQVTWRLTGGIPSRQPVVTVSNGAVPFALTFDRAGRLQVAEASGAVSTYRVAKSGALSVISASVANGQAATCWSVQARGRLYVANAGSATVSSYQVHGNGAVSLINAAAAHTGAGAVDLAVSADQRFLYQVAAGAGEIDVFRVAADGTLAPVSVLGGLPPVNGSGLEGIAAY
jgi:6-phosphogluconolactonase (cycloisomerase 2 family)